MSVSESTVQPSPGYKIRDKGIFIGTHVINDWGGNTLGRFNVFAAPQDLNIDPSGRRILLTFKETAAELAKRESLLGYQCCKFDHQHYEDQLYEGLKDGSAVGKWFIPTREILCGRDAERRKVEPSNLYDLRNTGGFWNTFCTNGSGNAHWYWSSSEHRDLPDGVWVVCFSDGYDDWGLKDYRRLSSRPVRVELAL